MRLDCPKCGAKGDSRAKKKPRWRCSPARRNGGCGYEWDDPNYDDPTIDYKSPQGLVDSIRSLGGGEVGWERFRSGYRTMEQYLESEHQRELERARRQRLKIEEEELRRNMPSTPTPPVSVPNPTPDRPVGGSWLDSGFGEGIAAVGVLVAIFVVAFIVLYLFYLFIGVIFGNEITAIVIVGVGLFVFCLSQWDDDSIFMYLIIALAYGLLLFFVVWASGADKPPPDLGEECRIEDRGGRIREVCW